MKVFTYKNQPWDNVDAWRLGEACRKAAQNPGGDYIDGGLELLKQLQDKGFGVVKLEEAQHTTSATDAAETALKELADEAFHNGNSGIWVERQVSAIRAAIAAKEQK